MRVKIFNLVKKGGSETNEFRSNTDLHVSFEQDIDLLNFDESSIVNMERLKLGKNGQEKTRTIYNNLNNLEDIFDNHRSQPH